MWWLELSSSFWRMRTRAFLFGGVQESRVPEGFADQITAGERNALPTPLCGGVSSPVRAARIVAHPSEMSSLPPPPSPCSLTHRVLTTVSGPVARSSPSHGIASCIPGPGTVPGIP